MSEEDRKLQKHLVDEMMKVSKTNPDVMFYMESLMKKYEELEQKVEQLETIINEAKEKCKAVIEDSEHTTVSEFNINGLMRTILNILNKGDNKE